MNHQQEHSQVARPRAPRARCSVFIAASLDGFIARADGRIDWLSMVQSGGEDYGYARFFASVDTLVLGRNTYETVLRFEEWPYVGKRCVVMTTKKLASRHGEEFHDGPPAALVDRLTAAGSESIYVDGGNVIRQFLAAGLLTDLTVSVIPVLLGEGIPLFGKLDRDIRLDLAEARSFESGLVQLHYHPRSEVSSH